VGLLAIALLAFEIFNYGTTEYALTDLMGSAGFGGLRWATILAVAFCAIDFAGLTRIFTPDGTPGQNSEAWYLMGAWGLGALMNAIMTWWAVSLTLLGNNFGNEILSREQLLQWVPFFVAILVLVTRILFIGALSVATDRLMRQHQAPDSRGARVPAGQLLPARQAATLRPAAALSGEERRTRRQPLREGIAAHPAAAEPATLWYEPDDLPELEAVREEFSRPVNRGARRPQPQPTGAGMGTVGGYRPIQTPTLTGVHARSARQGPR
jgi:hypothetical protein